MSQHIVYEQVTKKDFSDILDELQFEFTDAPADLLLHYAQRVIRDFCDRTNALRRTVHIYPQMGVHNYLIEPSDDVDFIAMLSVQCTRCRYGMGVVRRVIGNVCDILTDYDTIHIKDNELIFSHPRTGDSWDIIISVMPTLKDMDVDAVLIDRYSETIVNGVKARLYEQSDKPWTSLQRAQLSRATYLQQCGVISLDLLTEHQRGAIKARGPRAF
jgi:hypothetical protein